MHIQPNAHVGQCRCGQIGLSVYSCMRACASWKSTGASNLRRRRRVTPRTGVSHAGWLQRGMSQDAGALRLAAATALPRHPRSRSSRCADRPSSDEARSEFAVRVGEPRNTSGAFAIVRETAQVQAGRLHLSRLELHRRTCARRQHVFDRHALSSYRRCNASGCGALRAAPRTSAIPTRPRR